MRNKKLDASEAREYLEQLDYYITDTNDKLDRLEQGVEKSG